jgi:transposase
MGNLTSHKVEGVAELIMAINSDVVYLPPYSPGLNPIEMMWPKVKAHLRKAKARTKQALGWTMPLPQLSASFRRQTSQGGLPKMEIWYLFNKSNRHKLL